MTKPDLVFMTKENEHKLKDFAEKKLGAVCKGCGFTVVGPHDCPGPFVEKENGQSEQPS